MHAPRTRMKRRGQPRVPVEMAESAVEQGSASSMTEFTFSPSPSLEEIRVLQSKFAAERDWEKFHTPRNLLLALKFTSTRTVTLGHMQVGEVGELSEIFQWRGEVESGLPGWSAAEKEHVGQEMSDILIYLVRLAEICRVDLPTAVTKKFAVNAQKYPVDKAYGSMHKYTAYTTNEQ